MSVPKNIDTSKIPMILPKKKHPGRKRVNDLENILKEVDYVYEKAVRAIRGYTEADLASGDYDNFSANIGMLGGPLYVARHALQGVMDLLAAAASQLPADDAP